LAGERLLKGIVGDVRASALEEKPQREIWARERLNYLEALFVAAVAHEVSSGSQDRGSDEEVPKAQLGAGAQGRI
jgi:hypothetical protein